MEERWRQRFFWHGKCRERERERERERAGGYVFYKLG